MKNSMNVENVLKFFERNYGVKFIDINTKKPVLETIAKNKNKEQRSDYDIWLEQQGEDTKLAHKMGEF
jgi:hypothetical protein